MFTTGTPARESEIPPASELATPHRVLGDEARKALLHEDLEDLIVDVEITAWPTPTKPPIGRVVEVLGHPDDFGVDVEMMIRKHQLPRVFPPNVLAEAMYCGCEIVATTCPGGIEEVVRAEDCGSLVPVGDAEAMASAIASGLDRQAHHGRFERVPAGFDATTSARQYLALLTRSEVSIPATKYTLKHR